MLALAINKYFFMKFLIFSVFSLMIAMLCILYTVTYLCHLKVFCHLVHSVYAI